MSGNYFETDINKIWSSKVEQLWNQNLNNYWRYVSPSQITIEKRMETLALEEVRRFDEDSWCKFLHDEYFLWKYTAKNRLATTRLALTRYLQDNRIAELFEIKHKVLGVNDTDIRGALMIARTIHGLGIAGASGLLSILYPMWFGTVSVCCKVFTKYSGFT